MKKNHKLLGGILSFFVFFFVFFSSFFFFANNTHADTCDGSCLLTGCGTLPSGSGTCDNGGSCCGVAPAQVDNTCDGTCMIGGCSGFASGTGTCSNGGSCCSSQPAPTASITTPSTGGLVTCGKGSDEQAPEECDFWQFIDLLQRIMNFLLFVLAVPLAAISFAWAGWLYLSAAGNESKIKQAHQIFGDVLLGLCLALAAWLIVHAVVTGLGVNNQYNFLG